MTLQPHDCPEPRAHFVISAAVFLLEASCIIGIDPIGIPSTFKFEGTQLLASSGFAIEWPDDEVAAQVMARHRAAPDQVVVVECGPEGAVAYHPVGGISA